MSNETGEKTAGDLESEIEELRRRIATWQPMMKNTRPTDAANLRDQIGDAEIRIQDLSEMKRQSSGSELNGGGKKDMAISRQAVRKGIIERAEFGAMKANSPELYHAIVMLLAYIDHDFSQIEPFEGPYGFRAKSQGKGASVNGSGIHSLSRSESDR
jgi:hypothetical protein